MVLPAPNLDDRDFQSLVDEAKRLVQRRCPEWTDHNVSDPGVTLIEAFAQMVDQLIYRLNRVPDRHYVKFLELIGVRLFPPTAARGTVTFWLSAAQPAAVLVRAETEVATPRTDTDEPVVFSTTADLDIVPCSFGAVATAPAGGDAQDLTPTIEAGQQVPAFAERPQVGDALLIGLSNPVPSCAVLLRIECPVGGVGIDPRRPPLVWEAWNGSGWSECEVDRDETGGLNRNGDVVLHVPATHEASLVARRRGGWLRCRVTAGTPAYTRTPRIAAIKAMTVGGTAEIVHAETVHDEDLGTSDGTAGQRFALARRPVVPWEEPSVLRVATSGARGAAPGEEDGERVEEWLPVRDFAVSGPEDRHFRLDPVTGEVELGPAVRQPDGTVRQYGGVPPLGARLSLSAYRVGGGHHGNVTRGVVRVLKTSVPYVSRVESRHPASGGADGETMQNARIRGPLELRASGRAVTADDFEALARDVAPDAARVKCLAASEDAAGPGGVRVLVVPRVVTDEYGRTAFDELARPSMELMGRIGSHLDQRRLIGTRLVVEPPAYLGVTVVARITAEPGRGDDAVQEAAMRALYEYLSPLTGGPAGDGWPFGRTVHAFDISGVLTRVPGVALVEDLLLFPADPQTGQRQQPAARIDLPPYALVYSYQHQVRVES
jgi:predicted phage baseplate assembly protein